MATGISEMCGDEGKSEKLHIIGREAIKRIQPGEHGHDLDLMSKPQNLMTLCIPCHKLTDSHIYRRWMLKMEKELTKPKKKNRRWTPKHKATASRGNQCSHIYEKGSRKGRRCRAKNRKIPKGGFCHAHRESDHQKSPMPPLRGWHDDPWEEPFLDAEEMACLQGIHQGWMDIDDYALKLFADWPEVWKRRWLYREEW